MNKSIEKNTNSNFIELNIKDKSEDISAWYLWALLCGCYTIVKYWTKIGLQY